MEKPSIIALSKRMFNKVLRDNQITLSNVTSKNVAFISINSSKELDADDDSFFVIENPNYAIFNFDDITEPFPNSPAVVFNREMGNRLLDFVEANREKEKFIVHCHAGVSRSGAVAAFLSEMFEVPYLDFKRLNPAIQPNLTVLTILREEYHKRNPLFKYINNNYKDEQTDTEIKF